jgi:RNA polymerase sigma factor (sigma-70 family)
VHRISSIADAFLSVRKQLARLVSRVVPPADIEDVVQETFVRSYEAELAQRIVHPRAFLLRTARNLALNHVDRSAFRLEDPLDVDDEQRSLASSDGPDRQLESHQRMLLFCRAVRELPLQCRRAFLLKKVYGMSQREIALYLAISESTVEKHVAKGILRCATYLRAHGETVAAPSESQDRAASRRRPRVAGADRV